jgi:hypothetical protein
LHGIQAISIPKIRNFIKSKADTGFKVPCKEVVSRLLKENLNLRFANFDGQNIKYRDPSYNEKRLWICRLMVQLYKDEVLLISIDESHFRSDMNSSR